MKKLIVSVMLTAGIISMASAQSTPSTEKIRINGYAAYVFDDDVSSYYDANNYYDGTIKGGLQWGVGIEYMLSPSKGIEIKYLRQDATAPMRFYDYNAIPPKPNQKDFEVGINYILIGGSNYFHLQNKVIEPYAGLGIGMAIIDIKNPSANATSSSTTKFAWDLKGGTNFWISQAVAIKINIELLSAVQAAGGGLYFGTGGAGAGVSTYSTMYQFSLGGGLAFKLGGKK